MISSPLDNLSEWVGSAKAGDSYVYWQTNNGTITRDSGSGETKKMAFSLWLGGWHDLTQRLVRRCESGKSTYEYIITKRRELDKEPRLGFLGKPPNPRHPKEGADEEAIQTQGLAP